MYDPWGELDPDVTVEIAELPEHMDGCCDVAAKKIWLAKGLTQAERRVTLCHELIHLERGGVPDDEQLAEEEERWVEKQTARRLINIRDLARALQIYRTFDQVAEELWVDKQTVRARLRWLHPNEKHFLRGRLSQDPA